MFPTRSTPRSYYCEDRKCGGTLSLRIVRPFRCCSRCLLAVGPAAERCDVCGAASFLPADPRAVLSCDLCGKPASPALLAEIEEAAQRETEAARPHSVDKQGQRVAASTWASDRR
jgi:hypothetical protein